MAKNKVRPKVTCDTPTTCPVCRGKNVELRHVEIANSRKRISLKYFCEDCETDFYNDYAAAYLGGSFDREFDWCIETYFFNESDEVEDVHRTAFGPMTD